MGPTIFQFLKEFILEHGPLSGRSAARFSGLDIIYVVDVRLVPLIWR